ncbi:MAG: 5-(carboxyamino)imidazole ribonucleotide mutase [Spirochaetia bacterium]|nr:5-(carboxyamino)imidazole ribonucleotide mutase [Spirochaetia bacterium]
MSENKINVAIVMGSKSDWETMKNCALLLKEFNIKSEHRVLSAHRTPNELMTWLDELKQRECDVIIAAAGLAAHLGGVVASHSLMPVIGVPMDAGSLQGMDALLSMVQMPPGIPVAVMGIGKPGAINAALFAIQILSIKDPSLTTKLIAYRKAQAEKVLNEKLD